MTEFRRAAASVERLEFLVAALCAGSKTDAQLLTLSEPSRAAEVNRTVFFFDPLTRQDATVADDDWVVVAATDSSESKVSDELRAQFADTSMLFEELMPVMERMRQRCCARAELEVIRAQLAEGLPDNHVMVAAEEQDFFPLAGSEQETSAALLTRALELDRVATYGAKMAHHASELIFRFDTAHALYNTDVVPRIAAAVAASEEEKAAQRAAVALAEAARAELERKQAEEQDRHLLAQLLAASERGLERYRLQEEAMRTQRQEAASWSVLPQHCGTPTAMAAPCARAFS